jgi:pimeloyl-ACP methyl ester carboxylesterase
MNTVTSQDGTQIAFDQSGQGPALILVDGALCYRNFGPMAALAPLLTDHFTIYQYDRRGRGDSADTAPYSKTREIEDIAALIAAAGGSAYVYGTSSGAALALEAAAHGLNIPKVIAYEPPYLVDDSRPDFPQDYFEQLSGIVNAGRRGDAVEYFMVTMVGMPAEAVAPMRHAPMWPLLEAVAPTLIYDASIMGDFSLPVATLAQVAVPVLVVNGGETSQQIKSAALAAAAALPNAQHRILDGQGHDIAPDAIAPVIIEFFTA